VAAARHLPVWQPGDAPDRTVRHDERKLTLRRAMR